MGSSKLCSWWFSMSMPGSSGLRSAWLSSRRPGRELRPALRCQALCKAFNSSEFTLPVNFTQFCRDNFTQYTLIEDQQVQKLILYLPARASAQKGGIEREMMVLPLHMAPIPPDNEHISRGVWWVCPSKSWCPALGL